MKLLQFLELCMGSWRLALCAWLALSAAACGPGVGGTGIGSEVPEVAGFQASPVCGSALAPLLDCAGVLLTPGAAASSPGSNGGASASTFSNGRVRATVQGNRIDLQAPCEQVVFSGEWGTAGTGELAFYGPVQSPVVSGSGQLQASSSGTALTVRLLGPQGQVVLGPVELPRQSGVPASAGC